MTKFFAKYKNLILLLIVLIAASFFRLWQLDSVPPGLYPDVAIYGNDGFYSFKTGDFKIFYPENNGREGLYMWLLALSYSIFGVSVWSIKIVTATIGILTVLGSYLLVKELFSNIKKQGYDSEFIALLSSFFLAVSFWHTNFSRIGFRAILVPFVLVFAFYFLFKGLRNQKILNFIISGIFFGLGFYTYISYRFIILLLPLILICWWFIYKKQNLKRIFILNTSYLLLTIFIVALPIGIYFLQNPQDFIGRAAPISIFNTQEPVKAFFISLAAHLGMFNFYGDSNWRHNYSGSPMLFWPIGILFLIGFIFSIREIIFSTKNKSSLLFAVYLFLISWFFIMLLPGILTFEGIPHSLRVVGVMPVAFIFAGLGGWKIYQFLKENIMTEKKKKLLLVASFLFLFAISFADFNKYFFIWGKNKETEGAYTKRFADIGYFLNSLPEDTQKYVIVNEPGVPVPYPDGIPMPAQTIMFIENAKYGSLQSTYLLPEKLDQIIIDKKPSIIVSMTYDSNLMNNLSKRFPEGIGEEKNGFGIFQINF